MNTPASYSSPKLEARYIESKGFYGVFARDSIEAGEFLLMWSGTLYNGAALESLSDLERSRGVQVEEDLYLIPVRMGETADYVNHSCMPNAGLMGQTALVALREIAPGEEICYDYAMTDGSPYDEFVCECGTPQCRGRVTGSDWLLPALQAQYRGYFSSYLQRRIDRLGAIESVRDGQTAAD